MLGIGRAGTTPDVSVQLRRPAGVSGLRFFSQQVLDCRFQLHAPQTPSGSVLASVFAVHMAQQAAGDAHGMPPTSCPTVALAHAPVLVLQSRSLPMKSVFGVSVHAVGCCDAEAAASASESSIVGRR